MAQQESINLVDFIRRFPDDDACRKYLFKIRWPEKFQCPVCNNDKYYLLAEYHLYQCTACNHQVSVTAGTVMHKTKVPLFKWFLALFLAATDKRGCSALTIQRYINVNYKTAWLMLHKMRHAMAEQDKRYLLDGIIQLDEASFCEHHEKQGPETVALVAVSTVLSEKQATIPLFAKIKVNDTFSLKTVRDFVTGIVKPGSKITTDCFRLYNSLTNYGLGQEIPHSSVPLECNQAQDWTHTIIFNAKAFIQGTYHGLTPCHLQAYLDEYCYRLNRRHWVNQLFPRLLNACVSASIFTLAELTG